MLFIPLFGWYLKKIGMIAIDRNNGISSLKSMKKQVVNVINNNNHLIVFPEGTRVLPNAPLKLQSGVIMMYEIAGIPVVPITLDSGLFWPKNSIKKHRGTINVCIHNIIPSKLSRHQFIKCLTNALSGE